MPAKVLLSGCNSWAWRAINVGVAFVVVKEELSKMVRRTVGCSFTCTATEAGRVVHNESIKFKAHH